MIKVTKASEFTITGGSDDTLTVSRMSDDKFDWLFFVKSEEDDETVTLTRNEAEAVIDCLRELLDEVEE